MIWKSLLALVILIGLGLGVYGCRRPMPPRILVDHTKMSDYPGDDGALLSTDSKCEDKDQGHKSGPGPNHCPPVAKDPAKAPKYPVLTGR